MKTIDQLTDEYIQQYLHNIEVLRQGYKDGLIAGNARQSVYIEEPKTTTIHGAKYCHENLIHPQAKFSHYDAAKLVPEGYRLMTREDAEKIENGRWLFDTERNGLWIADKEEDLKVEGKSEFLEADEDGVGRYLLADVDEDGHGWYLYFNQSYVYQINTIRIYAWSVRCVQI